MRIGIDASRANLAQRTGTEWYAFYLIQAALPLLKPTDSVHLYVKEPLRPEWGTLPPNVRVRILRWPPGLLWTQIRLSWELLVHRVEVLFVPAHTIPFLCPRRTLTTLHDIGFEHADELYGQETIGRSRFHRSWVNALARLVTLGHYSATEVDYHRFSAHLAIQQCATILTVSEYTKQDICATYDIDPDRVVVIPNAYNAKEFQAAVRQDSKRLSEAQRAVGLTHPYLMSIGRIERKKNTLGLVRAFDQLMREPQFSSLQLLLVGKPGVGSVDVDRYIHDHQLTERVIRPGWTEETQVPALMAGALAFVLPSFFEGFGIPVLEAMAVGTPVLCSNLTALPEVVGGAAELFDPSSPEAIATALQRVLQDPMYQQKLQERGYARAAHFSWAKSAELLVQQFYML